MDRNTTDAVYLIIPVKSLIYVNNQVTKLNGTLAVLSRHGIVAKF